jgi:hypothetical protein
VPDADRDEQRKAPGRGSGSRPARGWSQLDNRHRAGTKLAGGRCEALVQATHTPHPPLVEHHGQQSNGQPAGEQRAITEYWGQAPMVVMKVSQRGVDPRY